MSPLVSAPPSSVHALMCVLDQDTEVGDCPRNGQLLYYLTKLHATNWVIACSLICNCNLAYAEGTRLDCCKVISTADELGMATITLGKLCFVFCRLAPTDVASVQHERGVDSGAHALWSGHTFHQQWAWKPLGPRS
jgi:hypothetical protein